MKTGKILLIEDDEKTAASLQRVLESESHEVQVLNRAEEGLATARTSSCDLVITDLKMPGMGGLELIRILHAEKPHLPIILMTAFATTETAIQAMRYGAYEYLIKPFEMEEFLAVISKTLASARLTSKRVEVGESATGDDAIVGHGKAMQAIYKEIGRAASTSMTVMLRGETGTGKELVARAIYQFSDRVKKPFIAVNCAAIPETLLESELFGHERGSFTGATSRRIGRFEQADGGTLFLDEIGDMSLVTQAKLLRVLQDGSLQRLGGRETIKVNVRVIAATHRHLEEAIQQKLFREDLYYRLSVLVLHLPPLRERLEDIPDLVDYFLRKFGRENGVHNGGISHPALRLLQEQRWPGNIRQLANVVQQAMLNARGFEVEPLHLHSLNPRPQTTVGSLPVPLETLMDEEIGRATQTESAELYSTLLAEFEKRLLAKTYAAADGNLARTARWLGLSRQTVREKMKAYGVRLADDLE